MPKRNNQRAYTLTEILVVIGIMVLVLGMASFALNTLTGARSAEAAQNVLSATLARARGIALASGKPTGIVLFEDPASERATAALVTEPTINEPITGVTYPAGTYAWNAGLVYLATQSTSNAPPAAPWVQAGNRPMDLVADSDLIRLGAGVAIQGYGSTATTGDQFLSLCVVMFDADGRLSVGNGYTIAKDSPLGQRIGLLANLANAGQNPILSSSVGLVLLERSPFLNQANATVCDYAFRNIVPQTPPTTPADETNEESWIQLNGQFLVINRYNGTFLRNQ